MIPLTELFIRRATLDDLPALVALLADDDLGMGREDPRLPLDERYLAAFEAIDADPNHFLAVALIEGEVVGTLHITVIPYLGRLGSRRGQVEAVRISSKLRGAGLGRQLMVWAIEECRRQGCRLVQLTTDRERKEAHRFYEQLGFVATHLGYKLTL